MKRVRFQSPVKLKSVPYLAMEPNECHSPRPFVSKTNSSYSGMPHSYPKVYSEAVAMYDNANCSPFPLPNKMVLQPVTSVESKAFTPSSELDLSIFDSSDKIPTFYTQSMKKPYKNKSRSNSPEITLKAVYRPTPPPTVLQSLDNERKTFPTVLRKDDSFFLRPEQTAEKIIYNQIYTNPITKTSDDNEEPLKFKQDMFRKAQVSRPPSPVIEHGSLEKFCVCHPCGSKDKENIPAPCNYQQNIVPNRNLNPKFSCSDTPYYTVPITPQYPFQSQACCVIRPPSPSRQPYGDCPKRPRSPSRKSHGDCSCFQAKPKYAVDKKSRAIERYEKSIERENDEKALDDEKKVPEATVSDLIDIIKLQNQQLQLLQEKVDSFISSQTLLQRPQIEECKSKEMTVHRVEDNHHKISIGVMTSFEMFRTSTFINKDIIKKQNAHVHCNTSHISVKEIFTKTNPQQRFLEGITPINPNIHYKESKGKKDDVQKRCSENDRTVNDLSLCNLQIDNGPTPQISPDQTLQLNVLDYSDSDDEQSNVGWTYYNKVMTHVNGILDNSSMESSASAMYRNGGKCVQMHIDKSNVSVTKRVTFGDEQLRPKNRPFSPVAVGTDTSMKMNQLAAKYLKNGAPQPSSKAYPTVDMSFATRNYMERHQILQGGTNQLHATRSPTAELPKFLDITELKKQPKLL